MGILNNVAIQWLIRRVPEFAGIIVTLVTFYNSIPPEYQAIIIAIITGQGGGLTIGALIGFALWVYAQIVSYRATVKPQVVQKVGGKTVTTTMKEAGPVAQERVESVVPAPRKRTLFDILTGQ